MYTSVQLRTSALAYMSYYLYHMTYKVLRFVCACRGPQAATSTGPLTVAVLCYSLTGGCGTVMTAQSCVHGTKKNHEIRMTEVRGNLFRIREQNTHSYR